MAAWWSKDSPPFWVRTNKTTPAVSRRRRRRLPPIQYSDSRKRQAVDRKEGLFGVGAPPAARKTGRTRPCPCGAGAHHYGTERTGKPRGRAAIFLVRAHGGGHGRDYLLLILGATDKSIYAYLRPNPCIIYSHLFQISLYILIG